MPAAIFAWIAGKLGVSTFKLIVIVLTILMIVLTIFMWRQNLINHGRQLELQRIEDANRRAEEKANAGQKAVDDCVTAGGNWDRLRGLCVR